jgi:hypothetical protein
MLGKETYFALVNMCYKLPRKRRFTHKCPPEEPMTVLEAIATGNLPKFDRFAVAEFLAENTKKCKRKLPGLAAALDKFEKLFADVNAS